MRAEAADERWREKEDASAADHREAQRLQTLDRDLGYRIGIRLRAIYQPNVAEETLLKAVCDDEWRLRLKLHQDEHLALRQLGLHLYLCGRRIEEAEQATGYWAGNEAKRDALSLVQTRISKTLEQISGRMERLVESRVAESSLTQTDPAAPHAAETPPAARGGPLLSQRSATASAGPAGFAAAAAQGAAARHAEERASHEAQMAAWQAEARQREQRKREQVAQLLTTQKLWVAGRSVVRSLASAAGAAAGFGMRGSLSPLGARGAGSRSSGGVGGGGNASFIRRQRSASAAMLRSYNEELAVLEMEQGEAEECRNCSIVERCSFDGNSFELNANGRLDVRWGMGCVAVSRMRYNAATGYLSCGAFCTNVPYKGRSEHEKALCAIAERAGVPHNFGEGRAGDGGDEDEEEDADTAAGPPGILGAKARALLRERRLQEEKAREDLIAYAVRYRAPGVPWNPAMLNDKSDRFPHSRYMSMAARFVLVRAFRFLDEPHVQFLRVVNREFYALIESSTYARRSGYMAQLAARCGVSFVRLPRGQYHTGMPEQQHKDLRLAQEGRRVSSTQFRRAAARRKCGFEPRSGGPGEPTPITFQGLGDASVEYTEPAVYEESGEACIMEEPLTVRQWRRITEVFPHVAGLVAENDIELLRHNIIAPSDSRNVCLVRRDMLANDDVEDCYLELPYDTAAKVAACLAATLPSWQQWEAGVRTFDARVYPWGNKVSETEISLESLPFSWVVPNDRRGMRIESGYIELAESKLEVQSVHRAHLLPQVSSEPPPPTPPPPVLLPPPQPQQPPVLVHKSSKRTLPSLSGVRATIVSCEQPVLQAGRQPRGPRMPPLDGSCVSASVAATSESDAHTVRFAEPRRSFQFGTGTDDEPDLGSTRSHPSECGSQRPPQPPQQETPPPSPPPPSPPPAVPGSGGQQRWLKGVSCVGKEWNLSDGDCVLAKSRQRVSGGVLRSVADLFSVQDLARHTTPLPEHFLKSNHRAFSGPPAYCLAPNPVLASVEERMKRVLTRVRENEADVGHTESTGIQIRLKGRGLCRTMRREGVEPCHIAPVRARLRLVFVASEGVPQIHPCLLRKKQF